MIYQVFAIRDAKADAFLQPFFSQTIGTACRAVTEATSDSNHPFGKHAEDYALFQLGEFDDNQGRFKLLPQPLHISSVDMLLTPARSPVQPSLFTEPSEQE